MTLTFEQTTRRTEEEKASEERKHNEEITFLKKTNAQLKVYQAWFFAFREVLYFFLLVTCLVSIGGYNCAKKITKQAVNLNLCILC